MTTPPIPEGFELEVSAPPPKPPPGFEPEGNLLDQARSEGIAAAAQSIPGRVANWWQNLPTVQGSQQQLRAMYDQSPEKAAGQSYAHFVFTNPQALDVSLSNPMFYGMTPGEGLARSPISLETGTPPTPAMTARQEGYVVPPTMADEGGAGTRLLSGLGGKIKLQQSASAKNQPVTNSLAAQSLGLPADATLDEATFTKVRNQAGQAYQAVKSSGVPIVPDNQFLNDVVGLGNQGSQAAAAFPRLIKNQEIETLQDSLLNPSNFSTDAGIDLVRNLRSDATGNLKNAMDPAKQRLGFAQRQAADAVDDLMERNLAAAGHPGLVQQYRQARQLIAKSHDLEAATNTVTGDVSAPKLAALAAKGRPLSGELGTIANTAATFPKAMQSVAKFGGDEAHSGLDVLGSLFAVGKGRPDIAGAILGRPIVRHYLLSGSRQAGLPPVIAPSAITSPAVQALIRSAALREGAGLLDGQPAAVTGLLQ